MSKDEKINLERKEKYDMLIRAGYTSKEANIYKDYSMEYIEKILIPNKSQDLSKAFDLIKKVIGGSKEK